MNELPPETPNVRVSTQFLSDTGQPVGPTGFEDRDNFIRDLATVLTGPPPLTGGTNGGGDVPPVKPSPSASSRDPVLTIEEIKLHVRVDADQTVEDQYLMNCEMAARLHAENFLRYQIDNTVGENIKQALLFLIGHFYRNRESVTVGSLNKSEPMVLAFEALLYPERDFPNY